MPTGGGDDGRHTQLQKDHQSYCAKQGLNEAIARIMTPLLVNRPDDEDPKLYMIVHLLKQMSAQERAGALAKLKIT